MADATGAGASNWTALFLASPTPGRIIRFLQRRHRAMNELTPPIVVSDSAGPNHLRAVTFDGAYSAGETYLASAAPALCAAFSAEVTLLSVLSEPIARWSSMTWTADGSEPVRAEGDNSAPPTASGFLARLRGPRAELPVVAWAHGFHLPIDRLPQMRRPGALPIIDYETVAALDRKSLLVENSPRLYRFSLHDTIRTA